MPEFFLELFSEEIPARMQENAVRELDSVCRPILDELSLSDLGGYHGSRRIALSAVIKNEKPGAVIEVRGPRESAPAAALSGFLGKYKASRDEVTVEDGYYVFRRNAAPVSAKQLIEEALPDALSKFSWPKSMRWGQSADFTWVRPLRHIVCLLDDEVVPIKLGPITASNETEGHRFLASEKFTVSSKDDWEDKLRNHYVIADQHERKNLIRGRLACKAKDLGLSIVEDDSLLDEVTGLVEWPVVLIGKIDEAFMDLPPEVRELSMKVNQRYFALRDGQGKPAPYFAFAANIEAKDGGTAIIAGNERVLRARLSDARHFWDLDLKTPLDALLPKLDKITFHAKLGTQTERVKRLKRGAFIISSLMGIVALERDNPYSRAAELSKCDLVTGMVGEFPELQGIIGSYYASHSGESEEVSDALRMQYAPRGPTDAVPNKPVAVSLALADKFDQIVGFFDIGERPTGSGDPYALRRAALGIIRIILENQLDFDIKKPIYDALEMLRGEIAIHDSDIKLREEIFQFFVDRLRVKLRSEGQRFDVLNAVIANNRTGYLYRIWLCTKALEAFISKDTGNSVVTSYRRAANILRIEDTKDGPHAGHPPEKSLFVEPEEHRLSAVLDEVHEPVNSLANAPNGLISIEGFTNTLQALESLRAPVDAFFDKVTVNDPDPKLRINRLRLLAQLRDTMHQIADFSKIEG